MENYKDYLKTIKGGFTSPPARENMPRTHVIPTYQLNYHFSDGFPILTGKKMPFYSILAELICFMQGRTDVRDFENLGCSVWWDNAYKWNVKDKDINISIEEYKSIGMSNYPSLKRSVNHSNYGKISYDLGRIYSAQWTNWHGDHGNSFNQIRDIVEKLTNKPYERYATLTAWDPAEMNKEYTSQPNCHVYYQVTCVENEYPIKDMINHFNAFLEKSTADKMLRRYNDLNPLMFGHLTQRSCDAFLGVPFNFTSYSIFTIILAIITGNIPMGLAWVGVNNHIYGNHKEQVDEYLSKPTYDLPKLQIDINAIDTLAKIGQINSKDMIRSIFKLIDYTSNDKISAPLSVGL